MSIYCDYNLTADKECRVWTSPMLFPVFVCYFINLLHLQPTDQSLRVTFLYFKIACQMKIPR